MRGIAIVTVMALAAGVLHGAGPAGSADSQRAAPPPTIRMLGPTGVIGSVVDTDGRPVPTVAVRLIGTSSLRTIVTDPKGRFAFANVVPGEYVITARKHGFYDGAFGKRRAGGDPLPLTISAGQVVSNIRIELFRAAVITGSVLDEANEPVVGARVVAIRRAFVDGEWKYEAAGSATTDDHGIYRVYGLEPGEYLVSTPTTQVHPTVTVNPLVVADVPHTDREELAYPTLFYPSSRFFLLALPVHLTPGEVRHAVNFQWAPVPARRVSGRLTGPGSSNETVRLLPIDASEIAVANEAAVTISEPDGRFEFDKVPAGAYRLEAGTGFGVPSLIDTAAFERADAAPRIFWGRAAIHVTDEDIRNVIVEMRSGLTLSGAINLTRSSSNAATVELIRLPITIVPAHPGLSRAAPPRILPNGRFTATNLIPGEYFIRVGLLPPGWHLKSITHGGRNLVDQPAVLDDGELSGVTITLTDRGAVVHGGVRDGRLQPASGATVIVTPVASGVSSINRTRHTRASTNGQFAVAGLPAGEYLIVAFDDAAAEGWQDGPVLTQLRALSTRISLRENEDRTIQLRLTAVRR